MSIQLTVPPKRELKPRITVIGVGGAGGNAVNNMIKAGLNGVDFVVANTDAQSLTGSHAERRIQMGTQLTEGLGAGSDPEIGRSAAEEAMAEIVDQIQGSHMVFVTAGMGGGTGTGAAPVIARACREQGILTVGVVTKPFEFEGPRRMRSAEDGIANLASEVDTLIIIPNQNLFRVANEQTGFVEAFAIADEVLHSGVASVTDLMTKPGLINLDFADVKMVMNEMGKAMMGTGEADGENRALDAAEAAIANPLLEDDSMQGATGVLINITGGNDMTLYEVDEAATRIKKEVSGEANIIIGAIYDETLEGSMRVSVVATGIDSAAAVQALPESHEPRVVQLNPAGQSNLADPVIGEADFGAPQNIMGEQAEMPVTAEADSATMPAAQPEEAGQKASNIPDFLGEAEKPPRETRAKKRGQSFLDRVLRGRKSEEKAKAAPQEPIAPAVKEKTAEIDVAKPASTDMDTPMPEPENQPAVATSTMKMEPLMLDETPPQEIQSPVRASAIAAAETEAKAEISSQAETASATTETEMVEKEAAEMPAPEKAEAPAEAPVEAPVEASVEVPASSDDSLSASSEPAQHEPDIADVVEEVAKQAGEPTEAVADTVTESVAQAPVVSDIKPPEPQSVQSTVQTTMTTGGYDDGQLDIPAFLRRGQ